MASWSARLCVFSAVLACCSALSMPNFCAKCEINANDPMCLFCCKVNVCCVGGFAQPHCAGIQCGCPPPPSTTTTTPSTTTSTTTPSTTTSTTTTPSTTTTTTTTTPPTTSSTVTTTTQPATTTATPRNCKLPSGMTSRILGGSTVSVCDRPWMVHFMADTDQGFLPTCSGILISDTKILTSKPCVDEFLHHTFWSAKMVAQFADSQQYLQTLRKVTPDQITVSGNLAIVTVTKVPLDKAFCIDTVCLPDENTLFTEDADQKCKTASWGLPDPFETLKETDVSLMFVDTCIGVLNILSKFNVLDITVPSDGICSNLTASDSSACNIDAGGMLLCQDQADETGENWMLAGVTFGTPCDVRAPSTFVNVTKNLDFIMSNLGQ